MRKFYVSCFCAALLGGQLQAHVPFAGERWLENGGIASDISPEFYWELEVKRMAREFAPPEKRVLPPAARLEPGQEAPLADVVAKSFTSQIESADFDDEAAREMPTEFLLRDGYTDVANVAGGIDAWSQEIDPAIPRY